MAEQETHATHGHYLRRWWLGLLFPLVGFWFYLDAALDGHWVVSIVWLPLTSFVSFRAGYVYNEWVRHTKARPAKLTALPPPRSSPNDT